MVASLHSLEGQLERTLNAAQENPLFDIENESVIHHGAFYQASLSLELDGTTLALALTAPITHSRIRMLNDPDTNGGNAFLAGEADGSSGLMMVEYVAAGAIAEIRNAAQPASAGTLVLSRGAEEDATFASQGVQQLERSIAAYRVLLCCELVGAVRLLRQRGLDDQFSGVVGDALALAAVLPRNDEDRDLRGDIALAESASGRHRTTRCSRAPRVVRPGSQCMQVRREDPVGAEQAFDAHRRRDVGQHEQPVEVGQREDDPP